MADEAKISGNFLSLLGNLENKTNISQKVSGHKKKKSDSVITEEKGNGLLNTSQRQLDESRKSDNRPSRRSRKERTNLNEGEHKCKEKNISSNFLSSLDNFQDLNIGHGPTNTRNFSRDKKQNVTNEDSNEHGESSKRCKNQQSAKGQSREVRDLREDRDLRRIRDRGRNRTVDLEKSDDGRKRLASPRNELKQEKKDEKKVRQMCYMYLQNLLDCEISNLVTTLASSKSGFQETLNDRPIRPDLLILIVKVLNVVNQSNIDQLKIHILLESFKPEFFDEIKRFCAESCIEENSKRLNSYESFFEDILSLFETVTNMFPSMVTEKLKSVMVALNLLMKTSKDTFGINVKNCLFEQWKTLMAQINSYLEDKQKNKNNQHQVRANLMKTPNNFRSLPLIPTKDDFLTEAFLRQNITKGSFMDVEHYLDIQFRLLREDFIAPLRTGIFEYINSLDSPHSNKKYTNVKIYPKVQFNRPYKFRDTYGFLVNFDCDNKFPKNINWEFSKRLMVGSLLLFTDDCFQTFYLATVASRDVDNLKKKLLFVSFIPGTETPSSLFEPGKYFTMAESEVYYEAYRHVLAALKRMTEENFPMKQYIVNVDTAGFPPCHLINKSVYNVSGYKFDLLIESSWPSPEQLKLNPSQHEAFKSALTNDFVVIQGPPGTGKTFLALKIAEVLLKNEVCEGSPIVVICYTNHALDQFLEGLLKFTENIIRIGSQSQNEALEKYNIEKVRPQKKDFNFYRSSLYKETIREKFALQEKLELIENKIKELNSPLGILDLSVLRSVVVAHHYNELDGCIVDWLLSFDNPELLNQEVFIQNQTSTPNAASVDPNNQSDIFENVSEFQEGDLYIEKDDDENAQRLADMIEDDFYDGEFMTEKNYISKVNYSMNFSIIDMEINKLTNDLSFYPIESPPYFIISQKIQESIMMKNFINKLYLNLKDLPFDPIKLDQLQKKRSVWEICVGDRWNYYMIWIHLYCSQLKQIIQHLTDRYQGILLKLNELKQLDDVLFVKKAQVIGMTTSGAARRRVLLESLDAKIVIVEEAAEVLEAHIVTSLTQSVQHVILIGDHKQLKPNPAVYKLAKKYMLDVSLFERMLSNGLGCHMLDVQHRMRPEISSLVRPIYPSLMDHPSTFERPKISGIDKFVFFLTHTQHEDKLPDSSSKQNKYEADFLLALCQHLLLQGYDPEEITILATYTGQVWYMRKEKRIRSNYNPDWKRVRITPVDNFQGEENRIILLSLVRSNSEARIGFLSTENRVCVALSRAKEGLYIVGNMDNLTASSVIWPKIKDQLEELNAIGSMLTLRCARHPDQIAQVSKAKDFNAFPEGGCKQICDFELLCGHKCPRKCHIIDQFHTFHQCEEPCTRAPCEVEGHKCPLRCKTICEPCIIPVQRELKCGHPIKLPCHVEPASAACMTLVKVVLPHCNHEVNKPCHMEIEQFKCSVDCTLRLPCGHACVRKCHVNDDPDHIKILCMKDCVKKNETCRNNHPCKKRCHEPCGNCVMLVKTMLSCGHMETIECSMDESTFKCKKPCTKKLPCSHKCPLKCWLPCSGAVCQEKVNKTCAFGHTLANMKCCDPPKDRKCMEKCTRKLACGHPCNAKCFVDCTKTQCNKEVLSSISPACGHPPPKIPCWLNKADLNHGSDELIQLCKAPCGKLRTCGHRCEGQCGTCLQGRLHEPCKQNCGKQLICGHGCVAKCNEICPPCSSKDCFNNCLHHKCSGNHSCSNPCKPCTKPCNWVCEHHRCSKKCGEICNRPACNYSCPDKLPCGHPCMGFCGEPHPPLCRICDIDDPVISSAGIYSRIVLLEDCKHSIENEVLNEIILINEGKLLRCPECDIPIVKTMRFRSIFIKYRNQLVDKMCLINDEHLRLKKIHNRNMDFLSSGPTNNDSMNNLLELCAKPFAANSKADFSRLILSCILLPLATHCAMVDKEDTEGLNIHRLTSVEKQRLKLRLEYLTIALKPRLTRISYPDILQIELEVARIIRAMFLPNLRNFWYDVTEYSWMEDRNLMQVYNLKPLATVSATLKTRDAHKQWSVCGHGHLYVSENGEECVTCVDYREEEKIRAENAAKELRNHQQPRRNTNEERGIRITPYNKGTTMGRGRGRGRGRGQGRGRGRGPNF